MADIDRDSRNKIVSIIDKNFFVEAGAGSGKTTMLVNRMVAMVESGIDISKICAITFTKTAAKEFYERFQRVLSERSVLLPPGRTIRPGDLPNQTAETMKRCEDALKNIDLCFMGTIDAFCKMVISEHPREAGISSDADIITDSEEKKVYAREFVRVCKGEYGPDIEKLSVAFRSLHQYPKEAFINGATVFMGHRNAHMNYQNQCPPSVQAVLPSYDLDQIFKDERDQLVSLFGYLLQQKLKGNDLHYKSVAALPEHTWEHLDGAYDRLSNTWNWHLYEIPQLLHLKTGAIQIRLKDTIDTDPFLKDAINKGLLELYRNRDSYYHISGQFLSALGEKLEKVRFWFSMSLLDQCTSKLEEVLIDDGQMTFFDALYYVRNMLKEDAKTGGNLIKHIYQRHSHFLIDEFQDTNPIQAEVFFYLCAQNPNEDWKKCDPTPGSLFIVGDPKQSIYRFRNADVASYLRVKDLFRNGVGEVLSLTRNFRSTGKLCDYFNDVFSRLLPEETPEQSKFVKIPAPDDPRKNEYTGIYTYIAGKPAEEADVQDDASQIIQIIKRLVNQDKYKIRTKGDEQPRKIQFRDIMIIPYAKHKIIPIEDAMVSEGIPVRVEGYVPFEKNEALAEIYKVYAALADVKDQIGLYAALTGKLIGLTPKELLSYCTNNGKVSLKSKTVSIAPSSADYDVYCRVKGEIDKLKEMQKKALRLSPAALFSKIMEDYRVYEFVTSESMEVVYYTLELLRKKEKDGEIVSLSDGRDYIDLLRNTAEEERCLQFDQDKDCVRIANLHKVKGLEAPVVILAASKKHPPEATLRIEYNVSPPEGYVFKVTRDEYKHPAFQSSEPQVKVQAEEYSEEEETKRLIYVAGTRARNVLIINSIPMAQETNLWEPLINADCEDFFACHNEESKIEKPEPKEVKAEDLYADAAKESVLNNRDSEQPTYIVENPSTTHSLGHSTIIDEQDEDDESEDEGVNEDGLIDSPKLEKKKERANAASKKSSPLIGKMVHKMMEIIVSSKNKLTVDAVVSQTIKLFEDASENDLEELKGTLTGVAEKMRGEGFVQPDGATHNILSELLSANEVFCEVPFSYKSEMNGQCVYWNGVMDVVYRKETKWHIVDYKTNYDMEHLDRQYHNQMESYRLAFKSITGEDADVSIYHIDI